MGALIKRSGGILKLWRPVLPFDAEGSFAMLTSLGPLST